MAVCDACFVSMTRGTTNCFRRYGEFVGKRPVPFIVLPILVFGGLGAGLMKLEAEKDLEKVYYPRHSRALTDRQFAREKFPDLNKVSFHPYSQNERPQSVNFIFKTKQSQSIFDSPVTSEIKGIVETVKNLNSFRKTFSDICAKVSDRCVIDGAYALTTNFTRAVAGNVVTYPAWNNLYLRTAIGGVKLDQGRLVTATVLKISFILAEEADHWVDKFLEYSGSLNPITVEVAYEAPHSLSKELDKSTKGDIIFFSLTITMCCIYASIVTTGGNPVSTRGMLAFGGILAAGLGILGSMGLLSLCGVKFVNIVGVIPFLIIGIGVDDMFLMMSSWSECLPSEASEQTVENVPRILGSTLAKAAIGITITSVTNFLAFAIGTASVFMSVTNFSLYASVAVIFCYLANVTLFSGCLTFHGRRVYAWRHSFTCQVTKPRQQLKDEGRSSCYAVICGGSPPTKERDDESACEMFPSRILPLLFSGKIVSVVIIFFFLGYLAVSIYGFIHLKQGLILQNLVLDSSYYHKYLIFKDDYFPPQIPVGFYIKKEVDYMGEDGIAFENLLKEAQNDKAIEANIVKCWLTSFKTTPFYPSSTLQNFVSNLQIFLTHRPDFQADVVLSSSKTSVVASRCFVLSKGYNDHYKNADLMHRLRQLADDSYLPVFAYHWSFVAYEQFIAVLPATLQLVGSALAVMTVVTFVFLPHVLMVLLVVLTIVMILVGIFGFMHFWSLTLSSITMIHLVLSVGFSVDFSAHVCAAYLLSHAGSRQERARDAIRHAAGPILNGATSTMLGVLLLLASSSYIFQSFFKVIFLVILFGLLHAVFFLPAVLSLLGPEAGTPRNIAETQPVQSNVSSVEKGSVSAQIARPPSVDRGDSSLSQSGESSVQEGSVSAHIARPPSVDRSDSSAQNDESAVEKGSVPAHIARPPSVDRGDFSPAQNGERSHHYEGYSTDPV